MRVLTRPARDGGLAVQFGRSLEPRRRRARAPAADPRCWSCLGGVALAVALGRLVSRNVVAPIAHVTEAARHIAATEDLGRRIEVETHDEVGELAEHFNAMLDTLERSVAAQRQLVADASHELRTPITSLRTNIEVLAESESLPPDERARLLADVEEQTTELGMLVADLIELARGDEPRSETEDVRLDDLVARGRGPRAPPRARRATSRPSCSRRSSRARASGSRARSTTCSTTRPATRRRAAWSRCASTCSGVRVRDHGTGVDPEDLPHLFDRFYRGASARGRPGSGLGLAIVRQVAEQHGGSVRAANADGRRRGVRARAAGGQPGRDVGSNSKHREGRAVRGWIARSLAHGARARVAEHDPMRRAAPASTTMSSASTLADQALSARRHALAEQCRRGVA